MTIESTLTTQTMTGDGINRSWPFTFKAWPGELRVIVTHGLEEYDVTPDSDILLNNDGGGVVTYPRQTAAPALDHGRGITILRDMELTQETELVNAARFDPAVIEEQLDRLIANDQQLAEGLSRTLRTNPGNPNPPSAEELLLEMSGYASSAADDASTASDASGRAEAAATSAETSAANASASADEAEYWAGVASHGYGPASETEEGVTRYGTLEEHRAGAAGVSAQPSHVKTMLDEVNARLPAPTTADEGKALTVDAAGAYALGFGGGLPGLVSPYKGAMGGPDNKHPINRRTGQPDLRYALCDGGTYTAPDGVQVTTPDLRGKFVLAASDEHPVGETGGSETHSHTVSIGGTTLSTGQIPSHAHTTTFYGLSSDGARPPAYSYQGDYLSPSPLSTSAVGGSGSHTHTGSGESASSMPPYYTLAYIMEL